MINTHPGVTHNYRREHEFNIWFTLGVPPNSRLGLDRSVELLGELAEVDSIRPLPALRFFKIGVDLDMKGGRDPAAKKAQRGPAAGAAARRDHRSATSPPSARCRATCATVSEPFAGPAERHGFTVPELLERGRAVPGDRPDAPLRGRALPPLGRVRRTTAWASGRRPTSGWRRSGR